MWLALLGIAVVLVATLAGFAVGQVDRVFDDPDTKREVERLRAEKKRQDDWKKKLGD
jgi:hypothetical protein